MKKVSPISYIILLFILFFSNNAFSQDAIIMLNGTTVNGKVEEVGVKTIKYHTVDNPDVPIAVAKGDVNMIQYANGSQFVVNARSGGDAPQGGTAAQSDDVPAPQAAPPALPVYEQPACPTEGYIWTPGYWAFGILGYYWVPGVWVGAPHPNYLWTPCYWGFIGGVYGFHEGYWGEHIGFYGGVDYGYGYGGHGYDGGRWEDGHFRYNTAVSHVDVTVVHTTYIDNTVVRNNTGARASFNGEGGVKAEANPEERRFANEPHVKPTSEQQSHVASAKSDKGQYASENHGKPAVASMNKPGGQHLSAEGHVTAPHPNSQPQPGHTAQSTQHTNTNNLSSGPDKPAQHTNTNTTPSQHTNTNTAPSQHTNTNTAPAQHTNTASPAQHTNTNTNTNTAPAQQQHTTGNTQQHTTGNTQQHTTGNTQQQNNKANTARPVAKPAPKPVEKK